MSQNTCFHCGDQLIGNAIQFNQKEFCCNGCKAVYQLLSENNLGSFYELEANAGSKPSVTNSHKYTFLDVEEIKHKFIEFENNQLIHINLYLPQIHCSSCIYLLENISKIEPEIQSCEVNFAKRSAVIVFKKDKLKLSDLAVLLDKIGYPPNFGSKDKINQKRNFSYLYKLGVAGFAFGSIMLWSFPEYLGIQKDNPEFRSFTAYLSLIISIPVLVYSANEFILSAYKALKFKSINLDVPITIGIIALYAQSVFTIIKGDGPGYMDSFAGFIFFLLIGKWFQSKTYESLSFDRDYKSYFPVAVTKINKDSEEIVELEKLAIDDFIKIRNEEIIPCDVELISDSAKIDYSFVTGESEIIRKSKGDFIYAGGKIVGEIVTFKVKRESNRSHLTQLWNDVSKNKSNKKSTDKLSIYFLYSLLLIALITAIAWFFIDKNRIPEIVVSVLIVACPCALALSKPFTFGNTMRKLGRKGLYLKNTQVIENLNQINTIVFDKTGTLTTNATEDVTHEGFILTEELSSKIILLANSSTHHLSRSIVNYLNPTKTTLNWELNDFIEVPGEGIQANIEGQLFKLGSANFTSAKHHKKDLETATFLSINDNFIGKFIFKSQLRNGIPELIQSLKTKFEIHILSGDNNKDLLLMSDLLEKDLNIRFNQTPKDKFEYIEQLKKQNKKVMMIGDGLNDSGALEASNVGLAVSEDVFQFTPASDAIIKADLLNQLNQLLQISKYTKLVLRACLVFSITYNLIGLSFAISGTLTPLVAAILMPLSSISIVLISTISIRLKK